MLHIGMMVYSIIVNNSDTIKCNNDTECDNETKDFIKKVKKAVIYSLIDMIIVGGIAFFSSMVAIGYNDLLMNIKIAFFSSIVTAGLTFFTEMRDKIRNNDQKVIT